MVGLLEYVEKLETSVKALEHELRCLKQPDMFKIVDKYQGQSTTLKESPVKGVSDLSELAAHLLTEYGIDHDRVRSFMARRGWDLETFLAHAAKKAVDTDQKAD